MGVYEKLKTGSATTEEALAIYDALDPVPVADMIGAWKGSGFNTGHWMDGMLETVHWHGKRFESEEHVHPLVFRTLGGGLTTVNPGLVMPGLALANLLPKNSAALGKVVQLMLPLVSTRKSRARLRMTEYRGKSSATMIYDQLPVNDVFRKVDADTRFGIMDLKGMKRPFFFVLRREIGRCERI